MFKHLFKVAILLVIASPASAQFSDNIKYNCVDGRCDVSVQANEGTQSLCIKNMRTDEILTCMSTAPVDRIVITVVGPPPGEDVLIRAFAYDEPEGAGLQSEESPNQGFLNVPPKSPVLLPVVP